MSTGATLYYTMENQFEAYDMVSFIVELIAFIRVRKKYWLLPVIVMALTLGGLLALAQSSAVAPFIYTLF